jgi:hypothetical protein
VKPRARPTAQANTMSGFVGIHNKMRPAFIEPMRVQVFTGVGGVVDAPDEALRRVEASPGTPARKGRIRLRKTYNLT